MPTLLTKNEDTTPLPNGILYEVKDPAGTPLDRKLQIGSLLGLTGYAFLDAATSAGATSATVKGIPSWAATDILWGIFDPGNSECEIRKLTISGNSLSWTGGLTYAHAANDPVLLIPTGDLHLNWFGTVGDGSTDDRARIDRAIAAANGLGVRLNIPPGTFIVGKNSTSGYRGCVVLDNVSNVEIVGSGMGITTIKRLGQHWTSDTHVLDLLRVNNVSFRDLTIDGNESGSTYTGDQHHNVYLRAKGGASSNIRFERVHSTNSIGTAFYLSGDIDNQLYTSSEIRIEKCRITNTNTSGIAHQRGLDGVWEIGNYFEDVSDSEFDYEPTGSTLPAPQNIFIEKNHIIHSTGAVSIQLAGIDSDRPIKKVHLTDNTIINGSVNIVDSEDITVTGNYVYGDTVNNNSVFSITQYGRRIIVQGNTITNNRTGSDQAPIRITRAGSNNPEDVLIHGNILINNIASNSGAAQNQHGVYINGAQRVTITDNRLVGTGGTGGRGVYILNNALSLAYSFVVEGNTIRNFGGRGIQIASGTPASFQLNTVTITGNNLSDDQETPTMTTGVEIGSTSGLLVTGQSLTVANNTFGAGITSAVVNTAGATQFWAMGGGGGGTLAVSWYTGNGSPEGNVTAPVSSWYSNRTGTAGTVLWAKTSGTGNTGWTAVA